MGVGSDSIRILIAEQQPLFRDALQEALRAEPDIDVVSLKWDLAAVTSQALTGTIDVALLDADLLPKEEGRTVRTLPRADGCRILVLTEHEDVDNILSLLACGANGCTLKKSTAAELIEATRAVHAGQTFVPRELVSDVIDRLLARDHRRGDALRRLGRLTRREKEVLVMMISGLGNQGIARAAVISPQTARTHIQNVLTKLEVHSRLAAVALVVQSDLAGALVLADE